MKLLQSILILFVRVYQLTFSPAKTFLFGQSGECRFEPSCSRYAMEALKTHGALSGSWLAAKRVCRCHPWGECGEDPVPPKHPKPFNVRFPTPRAAFRVSRS
jgi:putative membrane protein insertion efficiency factor